MSGLAPELYLSFDDGLRVYADVYIPTGGAVSYSVDWGDASPPSTGTPDAQFTHIYARAGTITVTVTVTDAAGGTSTATATADIYPNTPVLAAATFTVSGLTVTADASASGGGGQYVSVTWYWGDGSSSNGGTLYQGDLTPTAHTYAAAGQYTIRLDVYDQGGSEDRKDYPLQVGTGGYPPPVAAFTTAAQDLTVTVDASASSASAPGGITGYAWAWDDGTTSTGGPLTSHTYPGARDADITLTVTDTAGATSQVTRRVNGIAALAVTSLGGWAADDSQAAVIRFTTLGAGLYVDQPPVVPPGADTAAGAVLAGQAILAPFTIRPLRRVTPTLGARPALDRGRPSGVWGVAGVTDTDLGRPQLVIDGVDVTFFRDVPARISTLSDAEPFGDGAAEFVFAQVTPLDTPGAGDLGWLRGGVNAEVWLIRPDGTRDGDPWWAGYLVSEEPAYSASEATFTVQGNGALWQADLIRHRVPAALEATDIATVIAAELAAVPGRRYIAPDPVTTGITTTARGSAGTVIGYVQELLATATFDPDQDGGDVADAAAAAGAGPGPSQWTLARVGGDLRRYAITVKDRTTPHVTLTVGQPGLAIGQLVRDVTTAPNVLYGTGTATDGYTWSGMSYPDLHADTSPVYPMATAGATIRAGTTDAATSSGNGVSTWQRRMRDLGYVVHVDGRFSSEDVAALRAIQSARGLQVDGVLGPQSWAATFDVGSNAGDLDSAVRLPLAADTGVEPYLYAANGAVTGPNPAYDPTRLRVEADTAYGAGISKATARRSARAELARSIDPGWVGSLTLTLDPPQMSRLQIRAGMNVVLSGWAGTDLALHVSARSVSELNAVTLTVDSKARDALTVAALLTRDAATAGDVARRPGKARTSTTANDVVVDFDGESGAGIIPRHALYAGLWNVLRIPVSQVGRIARFDYTTDSPVTRFSLALFGAPITPADLIRLVGDPLNEPADGDLRPYVKNLDELEDTWGFIEAFGTGEQGAGYYPGSASDKNPVTGRMKETAAIEYTSANPPYLWVCEYAPTSTFGQGRMYPAPQS